MEPCSSLSQSGVLPVKLSPPFVISFGFNLMYKFPLLEILQIELLELSMRLDFPPVNIKNLIIADREPASQDLQSYT